MAAPERRELPEGLVGHLVDGRYRIKKYLAAGSFGYVYLAEQELLGETIRPVAFKLLKSMDLEQGQIREVFRDALAVIRLSQDSKEHPDLRHIVQVWDVGCCHDWSDRGYVVMELMDSDLESKIRGGVGLPVRLALDYCCQLARGMKLAHGLEQPILHRDIKPGNILMTRDGILKVADFGASANLSRVVGLVAGAGDLTCQAPESLEGTFVPASDVYSLGLLFYQMFTGRHPFRDLMTELARKPEMTIREQSSRHRQRRSKPITPMPELKEELHEHPALVRAVMRCLREDPAERFADAGELSAALDSIAAGREVDGPSPGPEDGPTPQFLFQQAKLSFEEGKAEQARGFLDRLFALETGIEPRLMGQALYLSGKIRLEFGGSVEQAQKELHRAWQDYGLKEAWEYRNRWLKQRRN
jgi:serine/threonine protein kinase